jgi:DNA repair protein RecN (Recombination protein N)
MLEELRVQNFAIIDQVELDFTKGFNVITGETGAGKSILIDAVELLLGGKADPSFVRAGAERAVIEGVVAVDDANQDAVNAILEREDLVDPDNPDYVTITREVRAKGRSTGRINGIAVKADILTEVGGILFDIHGQSEHLSLFSPRHHIDLLDRYADLLDIRAGLSTLVEERGKIRSEMRRLQDDKDALKRRADLLRHEVEEIKAASLEPDEEVDLISERNRLANSEQLANLAQESTILLNGDESDEAIAIVDSLMQVAFAMSKLAKIDLDMQEDYDLAESLAQQAQELGITMAGYIDEVEYDPDRLDELEERLELIKTLKRRYSCTTIEEILAYGKKASKELANIDDSEERLKELHKQETALLRTIGEISKRLSSAREKAGKELGQAVVRELQDLRMERTQFEVLLAQAEHPDGCIVDKKRYKFDSKGIDDVEFMMSANPGEPLRPLVKVASGGEAARIMLALKRVLTAADNTPILIFDEVDQGIGGRIGAVVGEKLWSLSDRHQVLVVTHLPQLASYGDKHFHVRKDVTKSHAATQVAVLTDEKERINELAEMLGTAGEVGKQSALGILEEARVRKMELTPT